MINKINIKTLDKLILISLSIHVICSQLYVAISSIGLALAIGLTCIRFYIDRNFYKPEKSLLYFFSIFIISILISSGLSDNPAESFYLSKRIFIFAGFFIAIIFFNKITELRYFLIVLLCFTTLVSLIEIIVYVIRLQSSNIPISELRIEQFGYPITNGEIKMMIILLFLPFIFTKENFPLSKLWIVIALIPIIISFFFTNARSAYIGLTAGIFTLGFIKFRTLLFSFIIFLILFFIFAPPSLKSRAISIFDLEHSSNKSRLTMWSVGLKMISDKPFFGYGDTDTKIYYERYKKIEIHGEGAHMHNNIMQLTISYGIIGLLIWLALMIYIAARQLQIYFKTKDETLNTLALISFSGMIALQISGLTEYNFNDFEFSAVFWFILSLSFISLKFETAKNIN